MIDQYIKEIEKDLQVDEFTIKDVAMKVPSRKHYWVGRLIAHKRKLMEIKSERFDLRTTITRAIITESPVKVSQPVAEKASYSHKDMVKLQKAIEEEELIVELLEKTEKTFSSMSFDISNICKIMQMEQT